MDDCNPCANVIDVTASVMMTHCDNDVTFLTKELIDVMAPRIEEILSALNRSSVVLQGIQSLASVQLETPEESAYYQAKDESINEHKVKVNVEMTETLLTLCRPEHSRKRIGRRVDDDDAEDEVSDVLLRVLKRMKMDYAASCLQRFNQAWLRADDSSLHLDYSISDVDLETDQPPRCNRSVLRESAASIIDNLSVSDPLISILLKKSIISQQMASLVLGRPNRQQQALQLIQLLMQLGPYSLKVFTEALRATDNTPLANILSWNLRHGPRDSK